MYLIHAQHPRPCTKCHTRIARGTLAYYPPLICTACHDALTEDERAALTAVYGETWTRMHQPALTYAIQSVSHVVTFTRRKPSTTKNVKGV
jgi:hypothetical protein